MEPINLYVIFYSLFLGLGCGIIAAVYKNILSYEPVLNWWFRFGQRFEGKWFYPAVWGCPFCIAGQLALWFYLFTAFIPAIVTQGAQFGRFFRFWMVIPSGVLGLLIAITTAILVAGQLSKFLTSKK